MEDYIFLAKITHAQFLKMIREQERTNETAQRPPVKVKPAKSK